MGIAKRGPSGAAGYALAGGIMFLGSLALFWPGFAMYDSVAQYGQALSGVYDDWHPPAMARMWAVLHPLGPGAGPMLVLQMGLYWIGFGGLAAALAATGRWRGALAVLAVGVLPPFLGWQAVVLKDTQATGALLAAAGLTAWWRLRDTRVPVAAATAVVLLIGYATLVRANAVFAAVPLGVLLLPAGTRVAARMAAWIAITLLVLVLSPTINHRIFAAVPTGVEHTAPLYDMAGIAARADSADETGLTPAERRTVIARACARPFFWDPLGDPDHCGAAVERLRAMPIGAVDRSWVAAILHHPVAYAGHRIAHLNSTDRWLVPAHWIDAAPAQIVEPNDLGLGAPGAAAVAWQRWAAALVETPLGWPIAYIAVAFVALAVARGRARTPVRDLAAALLGSALALEASFAVLSIASDLRYHLWPMIATALAVVLLADGARAPRRTVAAGAALLVLVVGSALVARAVLPAPPPTYRGMLG